MQNIIVHVTIRNYPVDDYFWRRIGTLAVVLQLVFM